MEDKNTDTFSQEQMTKAVDEAVNKYKSDSEA